MLIDHITPVLIAKDAEETIAKTLESLKNFKEVVIYLNNSSDDTKRIVQSYSNTKLIEGDFLGFGPTKNRAASYSSTKWVLSLDADEVLSDEFVLKLSKLDLDSACVYKILRTNYYKKKQIKHCWGDDLIVRLYDTSKTSFCDNKVHEYIEEKSLKVIQLEGIVEHYPYNSMSDFIIKLDRYSTIFAHDNVGRKKSSPLKAILNAKFSFFKTYFLKRGFLDGYAGLAIAFSHMATNFYKYIKLYELNKEFKDK